MGTLVERRRGRRDVLAGERVPVQGGFVPHPEPLFITEDNLRSAWQGQPKINPGPSLVQRQASRRRQSRRSDGGIVTAEVVVVLTPLLETGADVADIISCQIELGGEILSGGMEMAFDGKFFRRVDLVLK